MGDEVPPHQHGNKQWVLPHDRGSVVLELGHSLEMQGRGATEFVKVTLTADGR